MELAEQTLSTMENNNPATLLGIQLTPGNVAVALMVTTVGVAVTTYALFGPDETDKAILKQFKDIRLTKKELADFQRTIKPTLKAFADARKNEEENE